MEVVLVDTSNRRQVQQFLDLPFALYRDVPQWVPPLAGEAHVGSPAPSLLPAF
ncbi:MAG: hypothetical protein NT169_28495 [Chloroflexi bacterium]|nr:hypothetical protein [Chloroflexota bacterium]